MDDKLLDLTVYAFGLLIPDLQEIISIMESNNGSFPIKEDFLKKLPDDKVVNWASVYENQNLAKGLTAFSILGDERAIELATEIIELQEKNEPLDRLSINDELLNTILEDISVDEASFQNQTTDEFLAGLLTSLPLVYNFQSVMNHGLSMFKPCRKSEKWKR